MYISNLMFLHNMFLGTRVALFIGHGLQVSTKTGLRDRKWKGVEGEIETSDYSIITFLQHSMHIV